MAPPVPGASSISVAVRVRPFTIREAAQLTRNDDGTVFLGDGSLASVPTPKLHQRGIRSVIKVVDERCLVFDPPEDNPVQKFSRSVVPTGKRVKDQVFAFDRIFDENVTQTDVYEATTKNLLDSVLDGYNATVFAYGATGCGKTHTITGTSSQPGIIFLTMQELFEKINDRSQEKATEVSLSYLEIYNETIRDLLVPGGSKQGLMLREDSNQTVTVAGLTSHHPRDVQEVMDMIVRGNEYRTVSPTEANATSSRSHAVLQINVAQKDRNADVSEPHTMATLSIIDLAGSERASATKNRGERLFEGANINKSLLALGSCINALCDPRKRNHVPYRNSKLTRLLKFSLGGNCRTVMIVCISPSSVHFDETQNTLRYANRAKNIQTKVTRNVFNVNRHVKDFLVKIDEQMALINELRAQQKDSESIFLDRVRKQISRRDVIRREGLQRIRTAYENAAPDRQNHVNDMKRLKAVEKRICLLSNWVEAFDEVCETHAGSDPDAMPPSLVTIRKTANGILAELEHSRHHLHKKLENSAWETVLDTALQHSIRQLPDGDDTIDCGEALALTRETELLKANFARDMYREALEGDKSGDASTMRILLSAQFEIVTSLSETLAMSEEEAVTHAKAIIHRLLESGFAAASRVVKPDGPVPSLGSVDMLPPHKKGTPKRRRPTQLRESTSRPVPGPVFASAPITQLASVSEVPDAAPEPPTMSPTKQSPRRRKASTAARKGVAFTPRKRSPVGRRTVHWRDDDGEQGTLADFEKTPQKFPDSTPEQEPAQGESANEYSHAQLPSPTLAARTLAARTLLSHAGAEADSSSADSTPNSDTAELQVPTGRSNRFQAGFLSKSRPSSRSTDNSPVLVAPALSLNLAALDSENHTSPLRTLDASWAANRSPPSLRESTNKVGSPSHSVAAVLDENNPPSSLPRRNLSLSPSASPAGASGSSDSESTLDPRRLRSMLHATKQRDHRRASSICTTTSSSSAAARRMSSVAGLHAPGSGASGHHRASASSSGPLSSSTNGVSRHRRNSAERRRSPPITCSPPDVRDKAFTAGQARRMNLGGSVRLEASSPGKEMDSKGRRITIGTVASRGREPVRWR